MGSDGRDGGRVGLTGRTRSGGVGSAGRGGWSGADGVGGGVDAGRRTGTGSHKTTQPTDESKSVTTSVR
jgi:hypothetical protein